MADNKFKRPFKVLKKLQVKKEKGITPQQFRKFFKGRRFVKGDKKLT